MIQGEVVEKIVIQPMKWSELAHVDDVEPLSEKDHDLMSEIQGVLEKHNALDRFGLCLLHNHFDMKDGEYLFESTNEMQRTQTISVRKDQLSDKNILQTTWKFNQKGFEEITKCVLRCHYFLGHKQRHKIEGS
jgi:hypothetical protein